MIEWLFELELRQPWLLLTCLLAVPVFFLSRSATAKLRFSSLRLLPERASTWRTRFIWLPDALVALSVVAFGVTLAGPRLANQEVTISREGIAIMLILDTSFSMNALDLSESDREQTRLEVARRAARDFVIGDGDRLKGRPNDLVGLVTFARDASSGVSPTFDHLSLVDAIADVEVPPGKDGQQTAIGDGVQMAVAMLSEGDELTRKDRSGEEKPISKVAILLTDGQSNTGMDPQRATSNARVKGVKLYTIGVGSGDPRPRVWMTDRSGQRQMAHLNDAGLDDAALTRIAEETGGRYFRATDAAGLRAIYEAIDRLERVEIDERRRVEYDERFEPFLIMALLLAIAGWLLGGTVFRRLP